MNELPQRRRILLVEDEESLVVTLTDRLEREAYEVEHAATGETAEARAMSVRFDVILLDVALPGKNGFDVCRELRHRGCETPILMLTARGLLIDRVLGLKLGADDYLTKPFEMAELLARIEALLRRGRQAAPSRESYLFGAVRVDFRSAEVMKNGERIDLSGLEFRLLRYLVEHRGALLSRDELLDKVWGYDATPTTRTVDVHIAALRQKLEDDTAHPQWIVTVHGLGYKFVG